ncbi:MAG: hypothetical protein KDD40_12600, partial [Bdellovibrionales bacterium]|nr:hypothetical protein [Bdellovibrionales bacterium]
MKGIRSIFKYYSWQGLIWSMMGGFAVVVLAIVQQNIVLNIHLNKMSYKFLILPFFVGFVFSALVCALIQAILREQKAKQKLEHLNSNLDQSLEESLLDHKNMQKQLFHAQRLESIGRFTSGVAHEFNNILAIIHFSMDILQQSLQTPEAQKLSEKIFLALERAGSLIERMMLFSRKSDESKYDEVNFKNCVANAIKLVSVSVPIDIKLVLKIEEGDYYILGNNFEIDQVIINLI